MAGEPGGAGRAGGRPRELVRRIELAEHEAGEIAAARLRVGEADEIQARLGAGRHGEAIARGGAAIHEALVGEEAGPDGGAARDRVGAAVQGARELARFDPRFEPLAERLAGLDGELEDVAAEVRALVDGLDHDPAAVARLEERLSLIFALERRYGDDEAAVLAHGEAMAAEAERLRGLEAERDRRLAEDAALLADVAANGGARCPGCGPRRPAGWPRRSPRHSRSSASPGPGSRSRSAGDRRHRASRRSRSTATLWRSTRAGSTRSSSGSPRTSASRPDRSPGSPRAAS